MEVNSIYPIFIDSNFDGKTNYTVASARVPRVFNLKLVLHSLQPAIPATGETDEI
jgi:hypothetical protein